MGGKTSGNRKARGQKGHKGGTGRPLKPAEEKRTKHVLLSPRLWDKINLAAVAACESDWHEFLERVFDGRVTIACSRQAGARRADVN
jgi:hypothetical protein